MHQATTPWNFARYPKGAKSVRTFGALCGIGKDEGVVTPNALSSTEVTLGDAYEGTLSWGRGIFSFKGISTVRVVSSDTYEGVLIWGKGLGTGSHLGNE